MAFIIIRDGYTEEDEFPGKHWIPAFRFKYRPALPQRVYEYLKTAKPSGKETMRENVALVKEHLISWEVENEKGEMMSVMDDSVYARLPSVCLDYMVDCICSYGPSRANDDE